MAKERPKKSFGFYFFHFFGMPSSKEKETQGKLKEEDRKKNGKRERKTSSN